MVDWELSLRDLKRYPHFDAEISLSKARELVADREKVAQNAFYPFIMYEQEWQPFRSKNPRPEKKTRLIRYAARKDAYIFAKYRNELALPYEKKLDECGLADCVIAYRRILKGKDSGKCNIDFAKEAFDEVISQKSCCFLALDISKFFESLDHDLLKASWRNILGVEELPSDHAAVFKAITRYAYVQRDELYRRLGFLAEKISNGKKIEGYSLKFDEVPKKLCTNAQFRALANDKSSGKPKLINVNENPWGIPQGAPISDLLANIYMLEFDKKCHELAKMRRGIYRRYSDDILFVLPVDVPEAISVETKVMELVSIYGAQLKIKSTKTSIVSFHSVGDQLAFTHIKGKQGKNGAEYLGFRFDGRKVYFRDSTVSNLFRKMAGSIRAHVHEVVRRYPNKDESFLRKKLGPSSFFERFGRASDFDPHSKEKWTFWTYAKRSQNIFGSFGDRIPKQVRNQRSFIVERMDRIFAEVLSKQNSDL